jgi:formylmethanofuran--tetrahydromethanopterin N-formyltransferase
MTEPTSITIEEPSTPLPLLLCEGTPIDDTFAEAFPMTGTRLVITADEAAWAHTAATVISGYATSVISCDLEVAIERVWSPAETPDGRPGVSILAFAFSRDRLASALAQRVGQCVLTCPTTACYNGLAAAPDRCVPLGKQLRFFGDGWQISKLIGGERFWRIPVMDGEFVCCEQVGTAKGVAGGNLLISGRDRRAALRAAEAAVVQIRQLSGVALPFPGGIVRSGSKVGSRYKTLKASTNEAYCPTLRGCVASAVPTTGNAVYEIVIDGLSLELVTEAMRVGLRTASACDGVVGISAGNYGGKLGPYHIHLKDLLP